MINTCYVKFKYNKCFSSLQAANIWWALFCCLKNATSFFSLNLLETGLLYIMMNSSFMSVHHLVCHLDLNEVETHKVATISLALPDHCIKGRLKF